MATRCIKEIANDVASDQPKLSNVIEKDFYVDDVLTGANSPDEAVQLGKELLRVLNNYQFPLRKWASNDINVVKNITGDEKIRDSFLISDEDCKKTLGIIWKPKLDFFKYSVKLNNTNTIKVTKRVILSTISQIFDSLGLVGPVTIRAKMFLQRLWVLPLELFTSWDNFRDQLTDLNDIQIYRQCSIKNATYFEMHGFCDVSELAYGACLYLKTINAKGETQVRFAQNQK